MILGENFTGILLDPANILFRQLHACTAHYLLDTAPLAGEGRKAAPESDGARFVCRRAVPFRAIRYRLPEFIDFADPHWFRKPAPYAHYIIEGSADGRTWALLADQSHGP